MLDMVRKESKQNGFGMGMVEDRNLNSSGWMDNPIKEEPDTHKKNSIHTGKERRVDHHNRTPQVPPAANPTSPPQRIRKQENGNEGACINV
jgi:hypothetical protein